MPNKNGVCVIAFKMVSIEQTTSNTANISGSIRSEVLNTHICFLCLQLCHFVLVRGVVIKKKPCVARASKSPPFPYLSIHMS